MSDDVNVEPEEVLLIAEIDKLYKKWCTQTYIGFQDQLSHRHVGMVLLALKEAEELNDDQAHLFGALRTLAEHWKVMYGEIKEDSSGTRKYLVACNNNRANEVLKLLNRFEQGE